MAFLDHEGGTDYPYPRAVVFEALLAAIPTVSGMSVHSVDRLGGRILVKGSMSLMSWGENIPIVVSELGPGRARVSVTSTPKGGALFGGAFDLGKNRRNVERVLTALSAVLSKTSPTVSPTPPGDARGDHAERLAKLKDLAEKGLITPAEFEKRKAEILGEL